MKKATDVEAYRAEVRAVLMNEDIEALRAHLVKWGSPKAGTADIETLRVAWHKSRTAATDLPHEERQKSVAWLRARGFSYFSDEHRPDASYDEERLRVREAVLDAAQRPLFHVLKECAKSVPQREIAVFIRGSAAGVEEILAGRRGAIAEKMRTIAGRRNREVRRLAKLVGKYEPGFTPCAFHVTLADGTVDVSVVALRSDAVH
jgi:hypothetical protein